MVEIHQAQGGIRTGDKKYLREKATANEDKQMVLAFMADDAEVDPVSGNEVPPWLTT